MHTPRLNETRLSDFAFLDRDSVVAGVSLRDKVLNIYDTLIPPRQSLVQSHKAGNGGNLMQVLPDCQKVLCFNSKPGYVTEYDLRKEGEVTSNKLLSKEEITAVALSPAQDSLVLGQADGVVKIYDLKASSASAAQTFGPAGQAAASVSAQASMPEKSTINAFTNYGRKGGVTRLRFHPKNGALFAASNIGCVKLLRLAI